MAEKWYNDTNLVQSFGTALVDAEVLSDTDDFKAYLAKPFRYNAEFDAWQEAGYPTENDESWDEFVEAVSSDEDDDDDTDDGDDTAE